MTSSLIANPRSHACWIFQAAVAAAARSAAPSGRIPNSSPPSRATVSALAQRGAERAADLPEQVVALIVSERVVDLLEAVEINQQHTARLVGPLAEASA